MKANYFKSKFLKRTAVICAGTLIIAGLTACGSDADAVDSADAAAETEEVAETSSGSTEETSTETEELTEVNLGVTTSLVDHYIVIIGLESGIFEEYGLDIQTTEFASGIETVDAIVSGQLDIGKVADFAIVNRIGNTADDFSAKLLAKYESTTNYALYVVPEEISSLDDLAGQTVLTNPGTITDYFYALTFEAAGITEDDVTMANVSSGADALGVLEAGDAAAYWAGGSSTEMMEEAGLEKLITLEDLGVTNDDYYLASNDYISENPETLEKFLAAVNEIEAWITENTDEAVAVIAEEIGIETDLVEANLEAATLTVSFDQDAVDHLAEIQEFAYGYGLYDESYDITGYIDTTVLKSALPDAAVFD